MPRPQPIEPSTVLPLPPAACIALRRTFLNIGPFDGRVRWTSLAASVLPGTPMNMGTDTKVAWAFP